MIKVDVTKKGVVEFTSQFETQDQCNAWIAQNVALKAFGKPERWVSEEDLVALGEDKMQAVSSQLTGAPDEEKTIYKFASEYTISQSDVTEAYNQRLVDQAALNYLNATDWMVIRAMENPQKPVPAAVTQLRTQSRDAIKRT